MLVVSLTASSLLERGLLTIWQRKHAFYNFNSDHGWPLRYGLRWKLFCHLRRPQRADSVHSEHHSRLVKLYYCLYDTNWHRYYYYRISYPYRSTTRSIRRQLRLHWML